MPTEDGFKFVVPLGIAVAVGQNVLAAGHCRIQLHDTVYDLDEPVLLDPTEIRTCRDRPPGPRPAIGVKYLLLRRFAERPGRAGTRCRNAGMEASETDEPVGAEAPEALARGAVAGALRAPLRL